MRIGVVVIHGIAPHPRYQIQDEFATALTARLNESERSGSWKLSSEFRPSVALRDPESVRMTVDRVSNGADAIDVVEAYWSPIDKHQTNPLSVAGWILKTIFTPLNNNAKFPGRPLKVAFDLLYVLVALGVAAAFVGAALYFAGTSYYHVVTMLVPCGTTAPGFVAALTNPLQVIAKVEFTDTLVVLAGVAGAVFVAQAVSAVLGGALVRHRRAASAPRKKGYAGHVALRIAFVAVAGIVLLLFSAWWPLHTRAVLGPTIWIFIATVLALQGASSIGRGFLVDRLGDVQIYTIGDENSEYFTFRQQIRNEAETVLIDTIRRRDEFERPYYDKIVVAGHSLGTTVGMDALIRVHEIHESALANNDPGGIDDDAWDRVRAFITFGTALEKTKFFFAALRPSFSAAREEWSSKLYGHLFTPDPAVLRSPNSKKLAMESATPVPLGIFWINFWYPTDVIANGIESYYSTRRPRIDVDGGDRLVAFNRRLWAPFPRHFFPHSEYLGDRNFWFANGYGTMGALDVITDLLGYPRESPAPAAR